MTLSSISTYISPTRYLCNIQYSSSISCDGRGMVKVGLSRCSRHILWWDMFIFWMSPMQNLSNQESQTKKLSLLAPKCISYSLVWSEVGRFSLWIPSNWQWQSQPLTGQVECFENQPRRWWACPPCLHLIHHVNHSANGMLARPDKSSLPPGAIMCPLPLGYWFLSRCSSM